MFLLAQVEVYRLIRQPKLFENDSNFPKGPTKLQTGQLVNQRGAGSSLPAVGSGLVGIKSKLLSVGHRGLLVASLLKQTTYITDDHR